MNINWIVRGSVAGLALLSAGCASLNEPEPPVGAVISLTMAQQVMDPAEGMNRHPVSGMDGKAAKSGYDAYQKSYRAPVPPQNTFTIGIGGGR